MNRSFSFKILTSVLIFEIFTLTSCDIISTVYLGATDMGNQACSANEIIFDTFVRSRVRCAELCTRSSACHGVFYNKTSMVCTACRGYSNLAEQTDTVFFKKLGFCGPPISYDHVNIGVISGTFPAGYELTYTCSPSSFFPQAGADKIKCESDGTWTTPICVYGPDVGMLSNGDPIPNDAIGCISTHNSSCLAYSSNPHVGYGLSTSGYYGSCFCDDVCSRNGDCCFDVDC